LRFSMNLFINVAALMSCAVSFVNTFGALMLI
jgi:hypothetical protein